MKQNVQVGLKETPSIGNLMVECIFITQGHVQDDSDVNFGMLGCRFLLFVGHSSHLACLLLLFPLLEVSPLHVLPTSRSLVCFFELVLLGLCSLRVFFFFFFVLGS